MKALRWRLARWIAPAPIMADPFPGDNTVFVTMRQDGMTSFVRADRFRLKSVTRLRSLAYDSNEPVDFNRSASCTRFVGTVAS